MNTDNNAVLSGTVNNKSHLSVVMFISNSEAPDNRSFIKKFQTYSFRSIL